MTIMEIDALIAEAKSKRLWLQSLDHPSVYFSPAWAEVIGAEKLARADNYPHGWTLIDAKEIAFKHKEHIL